MGYYHLVANPCNARYSYHILNIFTLFNVTISFLKDVKKFRVYKLIKQNKNIYNYIIEKYKRKMAYPQKNNPWLCLLKSAKLFQILAKNNPRIQKLKVLESKKNLKN